MEMDKISVTVTGANRVELAGKLRAFADNFDGTPAGTDGKVTKSTKAKAAPVEVESDDADEDFGAATTTKTKKAPAKTAAASFDEDDVTEEAAAETTETEDDFLEAAPAKTAAAKKGGKKITVNEVNDACKAKAAASDRKTVLGILKKKFGVASVTELKAEQYGDVIKAMAV